MKVPLDIMVKVAVRTPRVFAGVARETIRCRTARWFDYRREDGTARRPRYIDIKMTNRCNLRCSMCGQWGENGTMRKASREMLSDEMSLDELKALVDDVAGFRPMFYLWGGEPFLYPDLLPFLAYLNERRLMPAINTNGTLLAETAGDLVETGVVNLLVSLDGPEAVHDRVRGVEGTYDRVMNGVEAVRREKAARRSATPYVTFVTTVSKDNVTQFDRVYDLAAEVGVDFVGLQFGTFTTPGTGEAYRRRMLEALGCEATSWKGFLSYDSSLDVAAVQERLRAIRARKHPFGTYFIPDLDPADLPAYYGSTRLLNGCTSCIVPWMRADILPNGDVYPCIDFPDYIVGNVRETPFTELWNGPRYAAFRRELQRGLLPICSRCCGFYQF